MRIIPITERAETPRTSRWVHGAALCLAGLALAPVVQVSAQTCTNTSCPSTFDIEEIPIQPTPTSFKFQARISQAKIPVGDAEFSSVIINLRQGEIVRCTETLTDVQVRDSVLNLEIGRGFACPIDDIIAQSSDLSFQICLNNRENCLRPIALATVPYSVKSRLALQAQEAHNADVAAQCHYAHRVTADLDLFVGTSTGSGYYDYHTPLSPASLAGLTNAPVTVEGGYMQWTPVAPSSENVFNISGKDEDTSALVDLEVLNFYAQMTRARSDVQVDGFTNLRQSAVVGIDLDVSNDARVHADLQVMQQADVDGPLFAHDNATVDENLFVHGTADVDQLATLNQCLVETDLQVVGHADLNTTQSETLEVAGLSSLNETIVSGGLETNTLEVTAGSTLRGSSAWRGEGVDTIPGNLDDQTFLFRGTVSFEGVVNLPPNTGLSVTNAQLNTLQFTRFQVLVGSTTATSRRICMLATSEYPATNSSCTATPVGVGAGTQTFTGARDWTLTSTANAFCEFVCF